MQIVSSSSAERNSFFDGMQKCDQFCLNQLVLLPVPKKRKPTQTIQHLTLEFASNFREKQRLIFKIRDENAGKGTCVTLGVVNFR